MKLAVATLVFVLPVVVASVACTVTTYAEPLTSLLAASASDQVAALVPEAVSFEASISVFAFEQSPVKAVPLQQELAPASFWMRRKTEATPLPAASVALPVSEPVQPAAL